MEDNWLNDQLDFARFLKVLFLCLSFKGEASIIQQPPSLISSASASVSVAAYSSSSVLSVQLVAASIQPVVRISIWNAVVASALFSSLGDFPTVESMKFFFLPWEEKREKKAMTDFWALLAEGLGQSSLEGRSHACVFSLWQERNVNGGAMRSASVPSSGVNRPERF